MAHLTRHLPLPLAALLLSGALVSTTPAPVTGQTVTKTPGVILSGVPFKVEIEGPESESAFWTVTSGSGRSLASGTVAAGAMQEVDGLTVNAGSELPITVTVGNESTAVQVPVVPGWFSLVPPLIAILLALIFREVVSALFAGIWIGALAVAGFNPLSGTWRVVDTFVVPALADDTGGKTQIVIFTLLLGGMVGVISRNGGTLGIVEALRPMATSRRRGKLATWLAGMAIFFDDYANTLIVGNTMRPITDRLRISREKLAYLVDSTAAPVAAIVPISTWAGYEISLIETGMGTAAAQSANPALAEALLGKEPFTVFLDSIPYLFYPLLALVLVFLTSTLNRDIGPMAAAERRAAEGDGLYRPGAMLAADVGDPALQPPENTPRRWWNAIVPVVMVIVVVVLGLLATGRAAVGPEAGLRAVLEKSDPFATLLWGSLAGSLTAILLTVAQRLLSLRDTIEAWVAGLKAMMIAMVILVLAWSLGAVTEELGTAQYLAQLLGDALPMVVLPALVFIVAAAIAFATGTSWATMAILLPLVIPLTVSLSGGAAFDDLYPILLGVISSVLAGSIFGDHCSPISDTTVLSSMASACDHVDHVRTQLPYALLVAVVGLLLGSLGTAMGLPNWVALLAGAGVLFFAVRTFGTPVPEVD